MRLLLLLIGVSLTLSASARIVELTDDNFEAITKEGKWLLELYALICLPSLS